MYTITGTICAESATCNETYGNEVFDYANGNDVPSMRMSLNITFPGHNFHPGTVRTKLVL